MVVVVVVVVKQVVGRRQAQPGRVPSASAVTQDAPGNVTSRPSNFFVVYRARSVGLIWKSLSYGLSDITLDAVFFSSF